jgi:hypothetical protein
MNDYLDDTDEDGVIPSVWVNPDTGEEAYVAWFPEDFEDADCHVTRRRPGRTRWEGEWVNNGGFNAFEDEVEADLYHHGFVPAAED